ncbi:MAG: O-antigen ligase family protein [Devosia sp.]|nr:O-antigen ligase family protein [Devosia sp.]
MTARATGAGAGAGAAWLRSRSARLLEALVAVWVFCGAMVITEPSPYELAFLAVMAVSLLAGFALRRATLPLLVLFTLFVPFAVIAAFQVQYSSVTDALIYQAVTIFLFFTAYWSANYVADAPVERMKLIMAAYLAAALLSAVLGTLGYFGVGHSLLTRYDRAKAFFNDPNVYGPFLVLPAVHVLRLVLLGTGRFGSAAGVAVYGVLALGVFVSFSRGAWGHLALSSVLAYGLVYTLEATGRQQARILILALLGALTLVVAAAGALSVPSVRNFVELRTQTQAYDTGDSGRFGRQGYAFDLALEHPFGLGPLEFRNLRVKEEPHNTYVNVLHAYGWGGGLMLIAFIGATAWRGLATLPRPGPARALMIPLVATFVPLAIEAAIIDIDHWRHFFLIGGLIWGVAAGTVPPTYRAR